MNFTEEKKSDSNSTKWLKKFPHQTDDDSAFPQRLGKSWCTGNYVGKQFVSKQIKYAKSKGRAQQLYIDIDKATSFIKSA